MSDATMNMRTAAPVSGPAAMSRLADRLSALAPAPLDLHPETIVRQSPAVHSALTASAAIAKRADERARRSRRSIIGMMVDGIVSLVPYALVALALRLVMASVFFFDGQSRVDGIPLPVNVAELTNYYLTGWNFTVIVPTQLRPDAVSAFMTQYPLLPLPPSVAAHVVAYAEFIFPVMLVLGFGTRFAALGLLLVTAMMQVYVAPQALWTMHIYWAAILAVLLSLGGGTLSLDHIFRLFSRR
jgi:putative oxidoreductase